MLYVGMDAARRLSFSLQFRAIFNGRHQQRKWDSHGSGVPVTYESHSFTIYNKWNETLLRDREPSRMKDILLFDDELRHDKSRRLKSLTYAEAEPGRLYHRCYNLKKHPEKSKQGSEARNDEGIADTNSGDSKYQDDAKNFMINLLSKRAYTTAEIRKKLLGRKFSPDVVELVITDSRTRGLINDSLYAETYARSRWSSSSWGPRRIIDALVRKGVSKLDAEASVSLVFHDGKSGYQESVVGMSPSSVEELLIQASKHWLRFQSLPLLKRKARMVRWLQYRGFNWTVTSFVLKRLQLDHPPADL